MDIEWGDTSWLNNTLVDASQRLVYMVMDNFDSSHFLLKCQRKKKKFLYFA